MIVVIDSGVWISGFQFGGVPLAAVRHAYMKHQIALCNPILQEISYSLVRKFDWAPARIEDALADYLDNVIHIEISNTLRGICRDPKDDMVIECAVEAGAEIIVSGDKDLLALDGCRSIRILTPREFLTQAQPG